MSTWRRHRAHRNNRASSTAPPGGEGWTIRDHRAILHSEPYASADLGAASDVTAKSMWSEAAPVSPTTAISPQLPSAVIAPAHRAAISWSATSVQVGDNDKPQAGVPGRLRAALLRSRRFSSRGLFAEYLRFYAAAYTHHHSGSGQAFGGSTQSVFANYASDSSSKLPCRSSARVRGTVSDASKAPLARRSSALIRGPSQVRLRSSAWRASSATNRPRT